MRNLNWLFALALVTLASQPLSARAQDAPFPYDALPTTVMGIAPPTGWSVKYFQMPGYVLKLGEITPKDQAVEQWRDLISYITGPAQFGSRIGNARIAAVQVTPGCSAYAIGEATPSGSEAGDTWSQILCYTREDGANTSRAAPLELYVFRSNVRGDAAFRMWRAWRGTPADYGRMLKRYGIDAPRDIPETPTDADLALQTPIFQSLVDKWSAELTASLEVCDLTAGPCRTLNLDSSAATGLSVAAVTIRGDNSNPALAREWARSKFKFTGPSPADGDQITVVASINPENHDFRSLARTAQFMTMAKLAHAGSGGELTVNGERGAELTPADAGRMRAYLLKSMRLATTLAQDGVPYEAFTFDLWQ